MSIDDRFFNLQSPHRVDFTYPIQPEMGNCEDNKSEINIEVNSKQSFNISHLPMQREKHTTFSQSKYQSKFVESLFNNQSQDQKAKNYFYLFDPENRNKTYICKIGLHSIKFNIGFIIINTFIILYLPIQIALKLDDFLYLFQIFIIIEIILDWIQFKAINDQLSFQESIIQLIGINKRVFGIKLIVFGILLISNFIQEQIHSIFISLPLIIIYSKEIHRIKNILQYQAQLFNEVFQYISFIHQLIILLNYLVAIYYIVILDFTNNYIHAWRQIIELLTGHWESRELEPFQEIVLMFIELVIMVIWIIIVSYIFHHHKSLDQYYELKKLISKIPNTSAKKSQLIQIIQERSKFSNFHIERIEREINIEIKIGILKKCFPYLSESSIQNIAQQIDFVQYINEPIDVSQYSLFYVLEGEVMITTNSGQMLNKIKKSCYFGEICFYTQQKGSTHSFANEECLLLKIDRNVFLENLDFIEKQIFHQKKDQIIFSQKRFGKCYCCGKNSHYLIQCPLIQYQPNIMQLIQQQNLETNQRQKFTRTRKVKSCNSLYMQSYYGSVEQDFELNIDDMSLEYISSDDILQNQASSRYMKIDSNISEIQQKSQTIRTNENQIILDEEIVQRSTRLSGQRSKLNTIQEISQDLEEGDQEPSNKKILLKTNIPSSLINLNSNKSFIKNRSFHSEERLKKRIKKLEPENQLFGESVTKFMDLEGQGNEMDYFDKMYEFESYFVNFNYPKIIDIVNLKNKSAFITFYKNNLTTFMQKVYSSTS